ncbi:unnamed protein product [Taenia asiatica]|uniref:7TM_GPCR_Srx domain-containing protein n=1 Tax=Taenia asiatica TaxID=60517 RepID=A0A0R3W8N6_TAEAS|nr:unnamed protein product [Taenia asiatica]
MASQLRAADAAGNSHVGLGSLNLSDSFFYLVLCMVLCGLNRFILIHLDMVHGCIANTEVLGITEFHNVNRFLIVWASMTVEMIIQVDKIVRTAHRKRQCLRN